MNHPTHKCLKCPAIFDSRGKRDSHTDRYHRTEMNVKFNDDVTRIVIRNADGWFVCFCGRRYMRGRELLRHSKACNPSELKSNSEKALGIRSYMIDFDVD